MRALLCVQLSLALLTVSIGTTASAGIVTFSFDGHLVDVSDPEGILPASITPFSSFRGTLAFDDGAPDQEPSPDQGYFTVGINSSISVVIDGAFDFAKTAPESGDELYLYDLPAPFYDQFYFHKAGSLTPSRFDADLLISRISVVLAAGSTDDPFASDALPGIDLDIADFERYRDLQIVGSNASGTAQFRISGFLASIDRESATSPVPEPSSSCLLASGTLLGMGVLRMGWMSRKRRRAVAC